MATLIGKATGIGLCFTFMPWAFVQVLGKSGAPCIDIFFIATFAAAAGISDERHAARKVAAWLKRAREANHRGKAQ